MHNLISSYIISKYAINHIKSSNIIKWLRVIQSERERERERITNKKRNRLREWKKERRKERKKERSKKRVSEKVKTLEDRKIENITLIKELRHTKTKKIKKSK